jgi:hypothetical protein
MTQKFERTIKGHRYMFQNSDALHKTVATYEVTVDNSHTFHMKWSDVEEAWKIQADNRIPAFVYDIQIELHDAIEEGNE